MCDMGHDDPGLQPADLLRRHTEQQEINVIPIKTAVAVHRARVALKSGAWQTSSLAHLGRCCFKTSAVRCHRMSPGGNDPTYASENENRPPSGQNCGQRAPKRASRGQRALGGPASACTWVWFHLVTNRPKCRRANVGVLIMEPPEKYVSEGDGVKEAPLVQPPTRSQTERPEDLPSGREPCHENSKGTCAAVG